jgi:cell division septation protein DedD
VDGFRVQILSLSDRVRAEQVARGLRHETGYNGYVEADGESYRIRAGDFMTREKAEEAKRRLAEEYGYDGAYVVATKIIAR